MPSLERNPLKKLSPDQDVLLQLLHRWRKEAVRTGRTIKRIVVAYEAGRDGFWLARWLRGREIEAYVIHPPSVPLIGPDSPAPEKRGGSFLARCRGDDWPRPQ